MKQLGTTTCTTAQLQARLHTYLPQPLVCLPLELELLLQAPRISASSGTSITYYQLSSSYYDVMTPICDVEVLLGSFNQMHPNLLA